MNISHSDLKKLMRTTSNLAIAHNDLISEHMLLKSTLEHLPHVPELVLENCRLCGGCGNSCWHKAKPGDKCEECAGTGKGPVICKKCSGSGRLEFANEDSQCKKCKGRKYEIKMVAVVPSDELWVIEGQDIRKIIVHSVSKTHVIEMACHGSMGNSYRASECYADERTVRLFAKLFVKGGAMC